MLRAARDTCLALLTINHPFKRNGNKARRNSVGSESRVSPNTIKVVFSLARLAKDTSQSEFRREMDFLNKYDSPKHVL